ncbi:MAG: iron ABC transporter permease [Pseudomonadota bacterium]
MPNEGSDLPSSSGAGSLDRPVATGSAQTISPPTNRRLSPADRQRLVTVGLVAGLSVSVLTAIVSGAIPISLNGLLGDSAEAELQKTVLFDIRGPRIVLAAFVGAALALAGAVLQGLFRNPLADPGLIGVSGGAAIGAICYIVLGAGIATPAWLAPFLMPLAAITGAGCATGFLYLFAKRFGHFSVVTMLLVGIVINALSTVGIGAFQYMSDERQLRALVFWTLGSFGRATWTTVIPALIPIVAAAFLLLRQSRRLDQFQLGEAEAEFVGVNVERLKKTAILGSAAVVGAGVALSGIISFVGLIVPHLIRLMGGASHRFVLPCAALLGATLMVVADTLARTLAIPAEIPVGLVTSAIGAPFFLWLITRVRAR